MTSTRCRCRSARSSRSRPGLGTINGIKIVPVVTTTKGTPPRGLALWLSDDARRLPLKIEAQLAVGKFTVTLRSAR